MPVRGTFLVGQFPLPPELVTLGQGIRKGRASADAWEPAVRAYVRELVSFQKELGVSFYSDGCVGCPDLYRAVAPALDGIELAPGNMVDMQPFPRRNFYYQRPRIVGRIGCRDPAKALPFYLDELPEPKKITLPGIYTFVRGSDARIEPAEAMRGYVSALLAIAQEAGKRGVALIELDESLFVLDENEGDVDQDHIHLVRRGLDLLCEGSAEICLNIGYGNSSGPLFLLDADAYLVNVLESSRPILAERTALGVADALLPDRTVAEPPELLAERAKPVLEDAGPTDKFFLATNASLITTPYPIAREKMESLAAATKLLEAAYG